MDFVTLYGSELDRELGSADRTQLFTTALRKAAINAAQRKFVTETECFTRQASIPLVDDTQEYDIEAATGFEDFSWIAKDGVSIKIVSGSNTRYIEGDDLRVTSVERLNVEEPGWKAVSAGTPQALYTRRDGGRIFLGLHPKPSIDTETWTAIVGYVLFPSDLSADADEPFTFSTNPVKSLRPWHRALVHYAAYDLEKLRKDTERSGIQLQLFQAEVDSYRSKQAPKGGQSVRMVVNYRDRARRGTPRRYDPRTYP